MARVAEYVRTSKLSGQVLKNRTGTLRRSIRPDAKFEGGEIVGKVGTNVSYARPHEFGGTFRVPSHTRMQSQAFGRAITPVRVNVRAHSVTFPERAFLRPSLAEKREEVLAALRGEITAALKE
jgi:phage gpG-like protein